MNDGEEDIRRSILKQVAENSEQFSGLYMTSVQEERYFNSLVKKELEAKLSEGPMKNL